MVTSANSGTPVIDIDSHYTEPPDLWTSRAPAKFRGLVPHVVTNESGAETWVFADDVPLGPLGFTVVKKDGEKLRTASSLTHFDEVHAGAYDVPERLKFLNEHGISAQIIYPNVSGFGTHKFTLSGDKELRQACVTIYNDAVADLQKSSGGRLFPQALVPFWDIEQTVAELKRAKLDLGLTGIVMCDAPQNFGLPTLDAPHWDPFWSTCEELDLPVNFHQGSGTLVLPQAWSTTPRGAIGATMTVLLFLNNAAAITNVVFSGLLLRHPALKVVSVESGVGWLPFLIEAMEYQFDETVPEDVQREWDGLRPRDLFRRNVYASFWFETLGPSKLIEEVGEDNVMFETDFPHPTCLYPGVQQHLSRVIAGLPARVQRKIVHDTAARVYNLPI